MKTISARLCLLLLLGIAPTVAAHSYKLGEIQVGHIWARATAEGAKAASVYVPLLNQGKTEDKLISVSTPVATSTALHESRVKDGISSMHDITELPLPPGQPVALRPGGKHIMLMGMKQQLKEGDQFPLTLTFAQAGSVTVDVIVHAAGATSGNH